MDKKIEVKNLRISFRTPAGKVQAVRGISFDLYEGETLAIVGESGSGKSVTNRAILGISAGNAMIEDGEILYNGEDLLKYTEDEYQQIRGRKIAMIFQDPMSSLNPIVKVGKQLTEGMILKARSSKKEAKRRFRSLIKLLKKTEIPESREYSALLDRFASLESAGAHEEQKFLQARENAEEALFRLKDVLLAFEKKEKSAVRSACARIRHFCKQTKNEFLPPFGTERYVYLTTALHGKDPQEAELRELAGILEEGLSIPEPDFLAIAMRNRKKADAQQDATALRSALLRYTEKAAQASETATEEKRKVFRAELEQALEVLKGDWEKEAIHKTAARLAAEAKKCEDPLRVKKDNAETSFPVCIRSYVSEYFSVLKKNSKETRRYAKKKARYDKMLTNGRDPGWELAPAAISDPDVYRQRAVSAAEGLLSAYNTQTKEFEASKHSQELVSCLSTCVSAEAAVVSKNTAKRRAIRLLNEVGIPDPEKRYNDYPFRLSGGQRQRIVIAIALSSDPDVLICDEPTTALDVTIQAQILELIRSIKERRGLSVIFITHDLGVVANIADRIAVMYAGKIVEYGTSEEIFYEPAHPYTWALLSSVPDLESKGRLEAIPGTPPNMIYPPAGDAFATRNKYALEIDFKREPPMFPITETHSAATWLLHPMAPKVDLPKSVADRIERMRKEAENG